MAVVHWLDTVPGCDGCADCAAAADWPDPAEDTGVTSAVRVAWTCVDDFGFDAVTCAVVCAVVLAGAAAGAEAVEVNAAAAGSTIAADPSRPSAMAFPIGAGSSRGFACCARRGRVSAR